MSSLSLLQVALLSVATMTVAYEFIPGINSKALRNGDPEPPLTRKFRLNGMKFCPFTERVQLYISRKNTTADVVNINLADKPSWYTAKHKKGSVPTLQLGDTIIGRDSMKIAELLDVIEAETTVLPEDEDRRSEELDRTSQLSKRVLPFLVAMKKHGLDKNQTAEKWNEVSGKLSDGRLVLQPILESSAFLSGDSPGYADYMIYPLMERFWILENMWKDSLPVRSETGQFASWFQGMSQRPEVSRIRQPLEAHIDHFRTVFAGEPDYDLDANSVMKH